MMLPWNSLGCVSELVATLLTLTGPMVEPVTEFVPSFWTLIAGGTYPTSDTLWRLLFLYCLLSSLILRFSSGGIAFQISGGK